MKRMQSALGRQGPWIAFAVVVAGMIAMSTAFGRAQQRNGEISNVSITHLEADASSRPLPVFNSPAGMSALHLGSVYEIYFNGTIYVPGLGPRQKLFVQPTDVAYDGWITVVYGDSLENKGMSNARVVPIEIADDVQPPGPIEWRIHYTVIAGVSPPLTAREPADAAAAKRWPE